ncbi:hypothetical protein [Streptomyces sirii]|uniref:hypothetical protein n=1 Tax=Streptomyces sirii TaxID=3127701 RepID=UPI003D36E6B5
MDLGGIAAVAAAGITALGLPATYLQARAARYSADNAVEAAKVAARALHAEARRTAQRDAYVGLLVAADEFEKATVDMSWRASLPPGSEAREGAEARLSDAHTALRKAASLAGLDAPEAVIPLVEQLKHVADVLLLSSQSEEDSEWPTDEGMALGSDVPTLYRRARRAFVDHVRQSLNADLVRQAGASVRQ